MGEVRFMISEAAKKVRVESHVLRYWEEELNLDIGRTEMGHRYYTKDDVQLFRCIKKLKDEGMLLKDLKPLIPQLKETRLRLKQSAAEPAQRDEAYVHSKGTEKKTERNPKTGTSLKTAGNLARAAARHGISFSESSKINEGQTPAKPGTVSADMSQTPAGQKTPRDAAAQAPAPNKAGHAEMEPEQAPLDQIDPYSVVTQISDAASVKKALHWGMAQSVKEQKASQADLTQTPKGQKTPLSGLAQTAKGQKASQSGLAQAVKGQKASQSGLAQTAKGQKASQSGLAQAAKGQKAPQSGLAQAVKGQKASQSGLGQKAPSSDLTAASLSDLTQTQSAKVQKTPLPSAAQADKGQKASQSALAGTDKGFSQRTAQAFSENGQAMAKQTACSPDRTQSTARKDSLADRLDAAAGHIMAAADKTQGGTASASGQDAGQKDTASLSVAQKSDVVPTTQLDQVRTLIGDVLTEVVTANNEILKKDISKTVTRDVMREMDFLFQARERQEEEHYRKLDCLIRQQQAHRRESARETPMGKLKKLLT